MRERSWLGLIPIAAALLLLPASAFAQDAGGLVGQTLHDFESLTQDPGKLTPAFRLAILVTLLSLAPALVMMLTCFVRVVVVLTLLRQAMDLILFEEISRSELPEDPKDLSLSILVPAYMLSELRTAFLIGFMLFLPFLVIDMVVASTLLSVGMIVVPPIVISLPINLMIFVLVDGWNLVVGALVRGIT
jgi:flagellar biosynthesis protein FliP